MAGSPRRFVRLLAAGALAGATAFALGPPASATAPTPDAAIRAAHFSPTTPGVDVYLARFSGNRAPTKLWLSTVRYGAVSPYQALTPGVYTVAMRPAGAAPNTRPVLTWTLHAESGAAYTVAGVGAGSSVRGVVLKDDLSAPPAGRGRVRVIQAASRAPVVKVSANDGQLISSGVHFATVSSYQNLRAGKWTVRAVSTSIPAEATTGPVTVRNGQITSILLLDAKTSGITLRTVLDSASSGVIPRDAVPAGGGGMASDLVDAAPQPAGTWSVSLVGTGALLLLGAAGALAQRRPHRPSRHARRAPR